MKKYIFISILLSCIIVNAIQAQKLIARQSGSTTTFHTTLDDAVTQANNDDILYIPGGYFDLTVPITKKIHIYGEGHNPKYSIVNGTTNIGGSSFYLTPDANGSSFQGIYFNTAITLEQQVKNISFLRCNIFYLGKDTNDGIFREYIALTECIVRLYMDCHIQYGEFNNCIFQGNFYGHYRSCNFRNCIFLNSDFPWYDLNNPIGYIDYGRFEKCIFLSGRIVNHGLCYFYDNIFTAEIIFDFQNLIGFNNIVKPKEEIFEYQLGNTFMYDQNYSLKDGTSVIGIYGGPSPWKDNCFPMNPQIIEKNISTYTNPDGSLDVNIKVEAQEK